MYLELATVLIEAKAAISESDIDEVMEGSFDLDKCLSRDIKFLPIRIHFDYDKILPLRRERARKQVALFMQLLSTDDARDYYDMVRKTFSKDDFLALNNELVELYTEEAFVINSSLSSIIDVDSEGIANRMYCSMLDIGIGINKELSDKIYKDTHAPQ